MNDTTLRVGNQSEFAAANGWTRSYVSQLKSRGRIVFTDDGDVDFDASLEKIRGSSGSLAGASEAVQGFEYAGARERERHYIAELRRLEYEREVRTLLPTDEVYHAIADAAAIVRTGVEAWRDKLPPQLVAIGGDEPRIAALLAAECEALLERLAQRFEKLAAGA